MKIPHQPWKRNKPHYWAEWKHNYPIKLSMSLAVFLLLLLLLSSLIFSINVTAITHRLQHYSVIDICSYYTEIQFQWVFLSFIPFILFSEWVCLLLHMFLYFHKMNNVNQKISPSKVFWGSIFVCFVWLYKSDAFSG